MFLILVGTVLIDSVRVWIGVLSGTKRSTVGESPFVLTRLQPGEL
jgi:hypothetical protein